MLKKILHSNVVRGSAVLFTGTVLISVLNYAFSIIMARMLGAEAYGEYMSLISLMYLMLIPLGAVLTIAMKYSAIMGANNDEKGLQAFNYAFAKKVLIFGLVVSILFMLGSVPLSTYLHMHSLTPFALLSVVFLCYFVLSLQRGMLRGMHKNGQFVISQVIESSLKVVFGVLFVYAGFSVNGAMGGFVAGLVVAIIISFVQLPHLQKFSLKRMNSEKFVFDRKFKLTFITIFIALLSLTVFHTTDVIMVKHYFPELAGEYSALSLLGKMIYFASMAVIGAMFPLIAAQNAKNQQHIKEFKEAFFLVSLIAIGGLCMFHVFPEYIVNILFGAHYASITPLVSTYSVFMVLISLNSLFIHYFLSIGFKKFVYYLAPFAFLQIFSIVIFHISILQILEVLIVINFVLLLCTIVNYYLLKKYNYE